MFTVKYADVLCVANVDVYIIGGRAFWGTRAHPKRLRVCALRVHEISYFIFLSDKFVVWGFEEIDSIGLANAW